MTVAIGIDLTQHVPVLCSIRLSGEGRKLAEKWPLKPKFHSGFNRQLPCAILPLYRGEELLVGNAAAIHRRSSGYRWPPESIVPYPGCKPQDGVARIPLTAVWDSLLPVSGKEDLVHREDELFSWSPGRTRSEKAGTILAKSVKAFMSDAKINFSDSFTSVVVPDSLDEIGQQILIDNLGRIGFDPDLIQLVPRPIAIAMAWCSSANLPSAGNPTQDEDGAKYGRLRILSTASDAWEAVSVEIRIRKFMKRRWLIPIRHRSGLGGNVPELGPYGLGYLIAMVEETTSPDGADVRRLWRNLFASDWFAKNMDQNGQPLCSLPTSDRLKEYLHKSLWKKLDQSKVLNVKELEDHWDSQEQALETSCLDCLGALKSGGLSGMIPQNAGTEDILLSMSLQAAAEGAAHTSAAIRAGLPSYRETLLPLQLLVLGRDTYDDPKIRWKDLVSVESVAVGKPWKSPNPITTMHVPEGLKEVEYPLKRESNQGPLHRTVKAQLNKATEAKEDIIVDVEVRPGQGHARVRIKSKKPGLFSTHLNWDTMKPSEPPKPQPLAWIHGVQEVRTHRYFYEEAESEIERALHSLEINRNILARLKELTVRLNQWHSSARLDIVSENSPNVFYGVLNSFGKLNDTANPSQIKELRDAIGERFATERGRGRERGKLGQQLIRTGGWFYTAIPKECLKYLQDKLKSSHDQGTYLTSAETASIGLAIKSPRELGHFFPIATRMLGNPDTPPNEWARAIRNICRFRNNALEKIDTKLLTNLAKNLFILLESESKSRNFAQKFRNSLIAIAFLLKRRRYDRTFLGRRQHLTQEIVRRLEIIHSRYRNHLLDKHRHLPEITVKFLNRSATNADLENLLSSVE